MLQAYSSNLSVSANTAYPLNNVTIDKGCAENLSAPATIQLNRAGVYCVSCNGYCTPGTADTVTTQLAVNGVLQPQAMSSFTGVAATADTFSFYTLVQVSHNNTNCCCSSPTTLQFMNGETAVTDAYINVVITKLC